MNSTSFIATIIPFVLVALVLIIIPVVLVIIIKSVIKYYFKCKKDLTDDKK